MRQLALCDTMLFLSEPLAAELAANALADAFKSGCETFANPDDAFNCMENIMNPPNDYPSESKSDGGKNQASEALSVSTQNTGSKSDYSSEITVEIHRAAWGCVAIHSGAGAAFGPGGAAAGSGYGLAVCCGVCHLAK